MRVSLAVAVLLLGASPACAQDDDTYRERIQEAVAEFDAHRFAEARALFRQAHAIQPNARTHRGIGLASFEMGDYVEAYRALDAALADERYPLTEPQRAAASEVRERARRFLGAFEIEASPRGAVVTVDGTAPVRDERGRLLLGLGSHRVRVEASGHAPSEATLVVRGGEEDVVHLAATPIPSSASPSIETPLPAPSRVPSTGDPGPAMATLVAGGGLVAGALVVGLAWWLDRDESVQRCVEAGAACFNLADLELARDAAAGTTVGLAVLGVVALTVGAVWLAALGSTDSVACGVGGLGVGCRGAF